MLATTLMAIFCAKVQANPTTTSSSVLTASTDRDLIMRGGASITADPFQSLRSGSPGQRSVCDFAVPLSVGTVIQHISFSYRYITGFGVMGVGANFTVQAGGVSIYRSPHLTDFEYDKNRTNYSAPVTVDLSGLDIRVAAVDPRVEILFDNNDRNLQLLLPFRINVSCSGGPCLSFPLLPTFINSNMVLQRAPERAALWGFNAIPGEAVTVELDQQWAWTGAAGANGDWSIRIDPQEASTGRALTVNFSTSGRRAQLTNIAFGDVYLCSGQSNMEFSLNNAFNASAEIAASGNYPGIRLFTAAHAVADSAQHDVGDKTGGGGVYAESSWAMSAPDAFVPVGVAGFTWFSAVCYFFGRDLYTKLGGNVPIGLVASDWGGQPIEVFSSPDALNDTTCGGTAPHFTPLAPAERQGSEDLLGTGEADAAPLVAASQLWWAMIAPFVPMRFTGAIWYQGEGGACPARTPLPSDLLSNGCSQQPGRMADNSWAAALYACQFPAMIADWRTKFALPNMSFFFVQLAPYFIHRDFTAVRNAQLAALKLPKTGFAVTIDLGDAHSPVQPIHPRRKQEVGRRLSLSALSVQYGMDVVSEGPTFASIAMDTSSAETATVSFAAGTAGGLHQAPTADCDQVGSRLCCRESPFEILAGGDWVRVNYTIQPSEQIVLNLPANASSPLAARYAWEAWPQCSVYNGVGGADDHSGIAGTPWCWDGAAPCPYSS